jgi:hypothetical protein
MTRKDYILTAFIVTAWSAHDELEAALKAATAREAALIAALQEIANADYEHRPNALRSVAWAALAKVQS